MTSIYWVKKPKFRFGCPYPCDSYVADFGSPEWDGQGAPPCANAVYNSSGRKIDCEIGEGETA